MAVTPAMVAFAESVRPEDACLVPEKREELTTEGGLDIVAHKSKVKDAIERLQAHGIHVSLFIDPDEAQIKTAHEIGAHAIEIHTGAYCNATGGSREKELAVIIAAAASARSVGLEVHGGHGLNYDNVLPIADNS